MQGWALAAQGQGAAGRAQMQQAMTTPGLSTRQLPRRLGLLVPLADAAGYAGQVTEGLGLLAEALPGMKARGMGDLLAEGYRLQGALLLSQVPPDAAQAEASFQQALTIARSQQARSWELRTAMSLARLWQQQDKSSEAYDLLAPIYGWFTEGFDTADLQEAQVFLDALRGSSSP